MKIIKKSMVVGALALALSGCGFETGSQGEAGESVGDVQEAFATLTWSPPSGFAPLSVGMSRNHLGDYMWTTLAAGPGHYFYCKAGGPTNPCSSSIVTYVAALPASQIRGVAIAQTNGSVYSWYENGGSPAYARGTADNLGALIPFSTPIGFAMSQLLEVEQSSGGTWHYYWRASDGTVKHSTSNSAASGGVIQAGNVRVNQFMDIAGITIDSSNPNNIWTFYTNTSGTNILNISNNAMDLLQ